MASPATSHSGLRRRLTMAAVLLHVAGIGAGLGVQSASAQVAATVRGVVRDAASGEPVAAALLSIDGRQALTSTDGSFRFVGLPAGTHRLRVEAFGYRPLEQTVGISVGMDPIELRLEPDPIQLQELMVTANARAALRGVVLNAQSGEPIPWSELTLTRGATQQVGRREASNEQGVFTIANVLAGEYLLRVERIGFESQYVPVSHAVPPLPLEVRLEPDPAVLRGLAVMNGELGLRRHGHARGGVRAFNEAELRLSRAAGMRNFLEGFTPLMLSECEAPRVGTQEETELWRSLGQRRNCIQSRGSVSRPRLFIDGMPVFDPDPPPPPVRLPFRRDPDVAPPPPPPDLPPISMDVLDSYDPRDFYLFEYFECEGGRIEMHVYTYQYMERLARQPRIPLPVCLP